jgi:hypothetical protein
MDERKTDFLKAVVGEDGTQALVKAAERSGPIENAIVPRAIMAWLSVVARFDYEGQIPGVEDSYLDFSKNDTGTYNGTVALGDGVFPFENATVLHLAAAIAVALGSDEAPDPALKDLDLARLGKSIDIMAKAKYLTDGMFKAESPGPAHAPTEQEGATEAAPPQMAPRRMAQRKPLIPKVSRAPAPKPKVETPKLPGVPKAFPITDRHMKKECSECGTKLFKNDTFVGCLCFRDLAKSITVRKNVQGVSLAFAPSVEPEAIAVVLETLGVR